MKIKKIKLINYRNYDNLELNFNDSLNIIIGNNAQGKTNILESIYVLAVTKSFLSNNDKEMIKFDKNFSVISGLLESDKKTYNLQVAFSGYGKNVRINGKEIKKLSDYISIMNVIVFSTDDIRMFKEGPSSRRKYFNIEISQIYKNYLKLLNEYNTVLRQRNEFLKIISIKKDSDIEYLNVINDKYSDLSIKVCKYRRRMIDDINKNLDNLFFSITGTQGLKLEYTSNTNIDNVSFRSSLEKSLNKDIQYKMTLLGPNRDDFYFSLNGKNLSSYGSNGQIRSAVLALKLSEVILFKSVVGEMPILLLDDIFSELDLNKRNNILKYLDSSLQVIVTTTDIDNIDNDIRNKANVYRIDNGKLFPGK